MTTLRPATILAILSVLLLPQAARADEPDGALRRELEALAERVSALEAENRSLKRKLEVLEVDRLIVRQELIVSDTGRAWEEGYEEQAIPRGIYARALHDGPGGLWVRSRLIKGEIDDPFDDRFHALERDGRIRQAPGHISWNVWLDGAWRQMAIVQGEGLEFSELPAERWSGGSHPGRIRIQTFRPDHAEPLTDALIGQGRMSLGGGGYGGGGLPFPESGIDVWGGEVRTHPLKAPEAPVVEADDGSGPRSYAVLAVAADGTRSARSPAVTAGGAATLRWDSVPGADSYVIERDSREIAAGVRIEGSVKVWTDGVP